MKKCFCIILSICFILSCISPMTAIANDNPYEWFNYNCNRSASEQYGRIARTASINQAITETGISLQENDGVNPSMTNGEFQHDSQIVYYPGNNSAYTFFVANKDDTSDSSYSPNVFCRLQKIEFDTNNKLFLTDSVQVCETGRIFSKISNFYDPSVSTTDTYLIAAEGNLFEDPSSTWFTTDYIEINPASSEWVFKTYDYDNDYRAIVYCFDKDKKFIDKADSSTGSESYFDANGCKRFNGITSDTKYVRIQMYQQLKDSHKIAFVPAQSYHNSYDEYNSNRYVNNPYGKDPKTINSGCGVPNAYIVGSTIHLLWSARCDDGIWYEFHNTFNCKNDKLGVAEICNMDNELMSCQTISNHLGITHNGQISMNASIAKLQGEYYACACADDKYPNGAILKTSDFSNWEFVFEPHFNGIESHAMFEGALGVSRADDSLYLALRQIDMDPDADVNPMILAKFSPTGELIDNLLLPSITSRPSFLNIGVNLILLMPSTNRENTVGINISWHYDRIKDSNPVFDTGFPYGNYVQMANIGGGRVFIANTMGASGIRVSTADITKPTDSEAATGVNHLHVGGMPVIENYIAPTCYTEGTYNEIVRCTICKYVLKNEQKTVPKIEHNYLSSTVTPTTETVGYTVYTCANCQNQYIDNILPSLPVPPVIITEYITTEVSQPVAKLKGTSISKLSPSTKQIKISWKKIAGVTGYKIQYSTDKKFKKNVKTVAVKGASKTSTTIKSLKSKKKYYFRIQTYNQTQKSSWSKVKSATVK